MKQVLTVLLLMLSLKSISQDSVSLSVAGKNFRPGIYHKFNDFKSNTPTITDPFKVIPNYIGKSKDSVINGYYYEFYDTTAKYHTEFCFFDGKQLYIDIKGEMSDGTIQLFTPVDYCGKYPFIEVDYKKPLYILPLNYFMVALLDQALSHKKQTIFYLNKKGDWKEASDQTISVFLRGDKDLWTAFEAEKKPTREVYKKYLIQMNERYPFK